MVKSYKRVVKVKHVGGQKEKTKEQERHRQHL